MKERKPMTIVEIASLSGPSFNVVRNVYTAPIEWMTACSKHCQKKHQHKLQQQPLEIKTCWIQNYTSLKKMIKVITANELFWFTLLLLSVPSQLK